MINEMARNYLEKWMLGDLSDIEDELMNYIIGDLKPDPEDVMMLLLNGECGNSDFEESLENIAFWSTAFDAFKKSYNFDSLPAFLEAAFVRGFLFGVNFPNAKKFIGSKFEKVLRQSTKNEKYYNLDHCHSQLIIKKVDEAFKDNNIKRVTNDVLVNAKAHLEGDEVNIYIKMTAKDGGHLYLKMEEENEN